MGLALGELPRALGAVCWDVGAHFGIHTVGLALHVGREGEVSAFEPDNVAFARLRRHVGMNRLGNVKLFHMAASSDDGCLELVVSLGLGSSVTHARYSDEPVTDETETFSARAVRLDTLLAAGDIRAPDLIKIDVEGHGGAVLEGARGTIATHRPIIVFSVHSESEWAHARSVLAPLGYRGHLADGRDVNWCTRSAAHSVILNCR